MTWQDSKDPLQAAVEYLHKKFSQFDWTGIYLLRGKTLELGPFVGAATEHTRIAVGTGVCGRAVAENQDLNIADVSKEANYLACSLATKSELVCLIRSAEGKILGQIDIDSHSLNAFSPEIEQEVRKVANELGLRFSQLLK